ncbi:MAG: bifunctional DNA primase/polymerase [Candidatus Methylomirabilia bacterium]
MTGKLSGVMHNDLDLTLGAMRARSWSVVLLQRRRKKPSGKHWKVTDDPEIAERHMRHGGNLGLMCHESNGLAALDADDVEAWNEMTSALDERLEKPWVKSGSGKFHYYVKWEPDLPAKLFWQGKKVGEIQRGPGQQQVVLPPSIHPDGGRCQWLVDPASEPLLPLPGTWRAYLRGFTYASIRR